MKPLQAIPVGPADAEAVRADRSWKLLIAVIVAGAVILTPIAWFAARRLFAVRPAEVPVAAPAPVASQAGSPGPIASPAAHGRKSLGVSQASVIAIFERPEFGFRFFKVPQGIQGDRPPQNPTASILIQGHTDQAEKVFLRLTSEVRTKQDAFDRQVLMGALAHAVFDEADTVYRWLKRASDARGVDLAVFEGKQIAYGFDEGDRSEAILIEPAP